MGIALGLDARRVQFTPDLMPSDILGTEVLEESPGGKRSFRFTITAAGAGGGGNEPPVVVEGEFEDQPPSWPLFAAVVLVLAALVAIPLVLPIFRSGGGEAAAGRSSGGKVKLKEQKPARIKLK